MQRIGDGDGHDHLHPLAAAVLAGGHGGLLRLLMGLEDLCRRPAGGQWRLRDVSCAVAMNRTAASAVVARICVSIDVSVKVTTSDPPWREQKYLQIGVLASD